MKTLKTTMSVNATGWSKAYQFNVELTLDGTESDHHNWILADRKIALQRAIRGMGETAVSALPSTIVVNATACGVKMETNEERINKLVAAGMPAALATMAIMDPNGFAALMDGLPSSSASSKPKTKTP